MTSLTARVGGLAAAAGSLRRGRTVALAGVLAGAGLVAVSGVPTASAADPVLTDFALSANGYSTEIRGGLLPVQSGRTGVAGVACTRFANTSSRNNTAAVNIPPVASVLRIGATTTHAFTAKRGSTISSNGHNDVARVLIGNKSAVALEIAGIRTRARAWHDGAGFGHREVVKVARVTRYDGGEATEVLSIPQNQDLDGERLRIPGLATVIFGTKSGFAGAQAATSRATALRINLELTNSQVTVGSANARTEGGAVAGIMHGVVFGSQLRGLGGIANSGRTAAVGLNCLGTDGAWKVNRLAGVGIPGVANLGEIVSRVKGTQGGGEASARGVSTITRAAFGDRNLVITGIRATGEVTRSQGGTITRDARGTILGSIVFQGDRLDIPASGRLEIPGVARIRTGIEHETPTGLRVTAVRVQLLQDSQIESTLNLGNVHLSIDEG